MGALNSIVQSGKALYVGLSNYNGEQMEQAASILHDLKCPFIINQNRYSIFDRTIEKNGLKDAALKAGKGIITFSPLAQGLLTDRYLNGIPQDSRIRTDGRFLKEQLLTEEKLAQIKALNEIRSCTAEGSLRFSQGSCPQQTRNCMVLHDKGKRHAILTMQRTMIFRLVCWGQLPCENRRLPSAVQDRTVASLSAESSFPVKTRRCPPVKTFVTL